MVASRTSADKVPPLEQFAGRKIDAKIDLKIVYVDYVQAINPLKLTKSKTRIPTDASQ